MPASASFHDCCPVRPGDEWQRNGPSAPGSRAPGVDSLGGKENELARQHLEAERDRLSALKDTFADEHLEDQREDESLSELASNDQHQADIGTETFEREKDLSILEHIEAELGDVEHALHRLDEGTYGTCEACGRRIDDSRLEAMPAARFCMDDQAQAEREVRLRGE